MNVLIVSDGAEVETIQTWLKKVEEIDGIHSDATVKDMDEARNHIGAADILIIDIDEGRRQRFAVNAIFDNTDVVALSNHQHECMHAKTLKTPMLRLVVDQSFGMFRIAMHDFASAPSKAFSANKAPAIAA